ncbi:amino acid adenylation domain-containing protein [Chitinophaga polysaccharea]|uniref:non-ribosomal peptide synthetase n=1 Tax=Chitinophaga polysaccharea TaxID=1293035 RepID=UPI001455C881|nr:amino acid adenylation domain-containing protein [Chitinophaga polysaccharea]NLR59363.1 amino acid adenylation domain-containing protein [Chitinophaga polysaccharea]
MRGDPLPIRKLPANSLSGNGSNGMNGVPVPIKADNRLTAQLLQCSQELNTSPVNILLTVFQILLYRYSSQRDIFTVALLEDTPIMLPNNLTGDQTFMQALKQATLAIDAANEPALELPADDTLSGVFVSNPSSVALTMDDVASEDRVVMMIDTHEVVLEGQLFYHDEEAATSMVRHYKQLLTAAFDQPNQQIGALRMLTEEELQELALFNHTKAPYPTDKGLHTLLEEQALKTPGNVALQIGNTTLCYEALNRQANQLARLLVAQGITPGSNVGLITSRGFNMIVAMYAILKAGAAYVPVDPDYPVDRQQYILSSAAVSLLLVDQEYPLVAAAPAIPCLDITTVQLDHYDPANPGLPVDSRQLAYTIYTSGSTGKPKGVMIEHHAAVNLILWVNHRFQIGPADRLLFITSMCFDLSVYDIFGILAAGGTIVIAGQEEVNDINQLQAMLWRYQITFWDSVPSTLDYVVKELVVMNPGYRQHTLRLVFLSGDWIPVNLPQRIKQFFPAAEVVSLGGATEATIWSNYFVVEEVPPHWKSIPYGRPITNNFFYILNEQLQPVPNGITGELYIGGVGVARGYAGEPEKTAAAFLADPFHPNTGGRMYRTGDLGRMLPDMNMEFIGRKDTQVKIRGFRVEPGEIEHVLYQQGQLESVVVLARGEEKNKKELIVYVVAKGRFDKEQITQYLQSRLPDYMIPTQWVALESMPLNINGKVDRKALLDMVIPRQMVVGDSPALTGEEAIMAAIWKQVLGTTTIRVNDNFFELGGHSLMALQIMSRFEHATGIKLPAAILFKHPTIASLLGSIERKDTTASWQSLTPIKPGGSKMPLYLVHGEGLYTFSFKELASYLDDDQPVFGLQPWDLQKASDVEITMEDIARHYVGEILKHNPNGPYAITGYSFGGYVAVEMERQLTALGKEVKLLGIFDTDAENAFYNKSWRETLPKKIRRQFPKFLWILQSAVKAPYITIHYQYSLLVKKLRKMGVLKEAATGEENVYGEIKVINQRYHAALKAYHLQPFDNFIYLFKAKSRINFIEDARYFGWRKYAKKGVKTFDVPGDHVTMLHLPHVRELGEILQDALNNC